MWENAWRHLFSRYFQDDFFLKKFSFVTVYLSFYSFIFFPSYYFRNTCELRSIAFVSTSPTKSLNYLHINHEEVVILA